ncbi:MAG: hypothetical protein P8Z38_07465 [Robiginitalea sp.]|jgi:hypothetical protein
MKKLIFLLILVLTGSQLLSAQMGRYGTYGSQRSSIPRGPEAPAREEEPKTAEELVAEQMPRISEAMELNDFEQAVVSSILTKYVQQRIELQILNLPKDQTMAALEKIAKEQNRELEQGLPAEKYELFLALQKNGFKSKKGRKKRQKKKKKKT